MLKLANFTRTVLCILFVLLTINATPQKIIEVKGATGTGEIVGRISYEEAKREALNQAKVDALRKAGVSEHLQSYESLYRSEINNDFSEFFSSDIQSELQGAVQKFDIVKQERKVDPITNLFVVEVVIDATVIMYDARPDPTFNVRIEGIKGIYENGEKLTFSVTATQQCYLHIFGITDNYTSLMFPNMHEKINEIQPNKRVSFPFEQWMEYTLEKTNKKGPELHRVLFVFTKKPVRYLNYKGEEEQLTSSEDIFSWVYSITPDERKLEYQVLTIR